MPGYHTNTNNHILKQGYNQQVARVQRYMEDVRKMYGRCMEDVWKMYGRCMGDVWKMYGRCMEDVRKRFTRNVSY